MLKNYLKSSIRNLTRNRMHTAINALGLSLGMTVFILIFQYVSFEKSFDKFHHRAEDVYRLAHEGKASDGGSDRLSRSFAAEGPRLKELFPEVKEFVRLYQKTGVFTYGDVSFNEENILLVDPGFFKVFTFPLVEGDPNRVLAEPGSVVISEPAAKKYFGNRDPLGQVLQFNQRDIYKVTGVVQVPDNSHLKFDFLLPIQPILASSGEYVNGREWRALEFYTYLRLNEGYDPAALEKKLPAFWKNNCTSACDRVATLFLQRITDIHLTSNQQFELGVNGNGRTVNLMMVLAFIILIVAWINYINLSTAGTLTRVKEVGVRLALGAKQTQLAVQFTTEAVVLNLLTGLFSIVLAFLAGGLLQKQLGVNLSPTAWYNPWFVVTITAVFVLGAILSGIPSSAVLASFKPTSALKPKQTNAKGMVGQLREGLSVLQFVCSITLLISTFVIYFQVSYLKKQDLGISIDQTLVVSVPNLLRGKGENLAKFRADVVGYNTVRGIAGSTLIPGKEFNMVAGSARKVGAEKEKGCVYMMADINFPAVYGLKIMEGQSFFTGANRDTRSGYVLNQAAARLYDIERVTNNDRLIVAGDELEVTAIVGDFYQKTTKSAVDPLILMIVPPTQMPVFYYSIKMNGSNVKQTVEYVQSKWRENFGGVPFDFFFLDDMYNQQYRADEEFSKLFGLFSILSIVVSGLGIFGLSMFNALRRTKEMGVRKVLGASMGQVMALMCADIVKLVLIANAIAWPLAYFSMQSWLENYELRVAIQWWWFLVAGLTVMALALAIMSYFTLKVAATNPVKSLKYE